MDMPFDSIHSGSGFPGMYTQDNVAIHSSPNKEQVHGYEDYRPSGGVLELASYSIPTSGGRDLSRVSVPVNFAMLHLENNPNAAVILDKLLTTFSLTKTQLSEVCDCTRKTLYNWVDGSSEPRNKALKRLFKLSLLVDSWQNSGLKVSKEELFIPIVHSESLFEMLTAKDLDDEKILFAGTRILMERSLVKPNVLMDPFA